MELFSGSLFLLYYLKRMSISMDEYKAWAMSSSYRKVAYLIGCSVENLYLEFLGLKEWISNRFNLRGGCIINFEG